MIPAGQSPAPPRPPLLAAGPGTQHPDHHGGAAVQRLPRNALRQQVRKGKLNRSVAGADKFQNPHRRVTRPNAVTAAVPAPATAAPAAAAANNGP